MHVSMSCFRFYTRHAGRDKEAEAEAELYIVLLANEVSK